MVRTIVSIQLKRRTLYVLRFADRSVITATQCTNATPFHLLSVNIDYSFVKEGHSLRKSTRIIMNMDINSSLLLLTKLKALNVSTLTEMGHNILSSIYKIELNMYSIFCLVPNSWM